MKIVWKSGLPRSKTVFFYVQAGFITFRTLGKRPAAGFFPLFLVKADWHGACCFKLRRKGIIRICAE